MNLNPDDMVDGRYKILSSLGEGGMGTVYKAVELQLNRIVALKFIHSSLLTDRDTRSRFFREGKVLSRLVHPNILTFYRLGVWNGQYPYIALEYAEGKTLRQVLCDEVRFEWNRAVTVVAQVADAMSYSHASGIVHRDLKPNNIMLVEPGSGAPSSSSLSTPSTECVKVFDFGLARAITDVVGMEGTITETGLLIGSLQYMSPEQCGGERVDNRSDIYSVGCILFELLAGELPFTADSPIKLLQLHRTKAVRRLSEVHDSCDVPPALDDIIAKATEKDPAKRYQSMEELRKDLLDVQGIAYTPVARRPPGRSKLPYILIPVILLAFVGVGPFLFSTLVKFFFGGVGVSLVVDDGTMKGVKGGIESARVCAARKQYSAALQLYAVCIDQLKRLEPKGFLLIRSLAERGELLREMGRESEGKKDVISALRLLSELPPDRFKEPDADVAGTVFDALARSRIDQQDLVKAVLFVGVACQKCDRVDLLDKSEKAALAIATGSNKVLTEAFVAYCLHEDQPKSAKALMSSALRSRELVKPEQRLSVLLNGVLVFASDREKQGAISRLIPECLDGRSVEALLALEEQLDDPCIGTMDKPILTLILRRLSSNDMPVDVRIRNAARLGIASPDDGIELYRSLLRNAKLSSTQYSDAACAFANLSRTRDQVHEARVFLLKAIGEQGAPGGRETPIICLADLYIRNGNAAEALRLIEGASTDLRATSEDLLSAYFRALLACNKFGAATVVLKHFVFKEPLPRSLRAYGQASDPPTFEERGRLHWAIDYDSKRRKAHEGRDGLVYVLETALKQNKSRETRIIATSLLADHYRIQRRPEQALSMLQNEVKDSVMQLEPYYYANACLQIADLLNEKKSFVEAADYLDRAERALSVYGQGNRPHGSTELPILTAQLKANRIVSLCGQKQIKAADEMLDTFRSEYSHKIKTDGAYARLEDKCTVSRDNAGR